MNTKMILFLLVYIAVAVWMGTAVLSTQPDEEINWKQWTVMWLFVIFWPVGLFVMATWALIEEMREDG